ncbi:MAG: apolipoprotein N-acyltransferase [Verrucomicrobia bacterium]|nr:apolipoprotein N-acyltransferase [Verrucomicrobiota bacterium]
MAFGQPAWCPQLCFISGICGFALIWLSVQRIEKGKSWWAAGWYFCVQLVQLSWLTSIEYQGYYILGVYVFLCACLGLQFGLLTRFFLHAEKPSLPRVLAAASLWTLMEWCRLFILCGFSWNPVGIALTDSLYFLQFASVLGIYGLTFWVILANGLLFRALAFGCRLRSLALWLGVVVLPCIYGYLALNSPLSNASAKLEPRSLSVGLVQTGLLPSQKVPLPGKSGDFIAPIDQWVRILSSLKAQNEKWDLIVFPEAVVPMRADFCVYPYDQVRSELQKIYGSDLASHAPPLKSPYAQVRYLQGAPVLCVSNAFLAQMIANMYGSEVVIGLDHYDPTSGNNYNSAFHFAPKMQKMQRYDKQVLLPLAEYLPFGWLKALTKRYGITEFFSHGSKPSVIGERFPFSISICYEETFPHLIRSGRVMGAELFINVTNDNYYPFSRLPEQHFSHARVRAVENGVYLLRSCNTGVTAAVDRFGRVVARLGDGRKESETLQGVLTVAIPRESHKTLYMFWGDAGIIGLAVSCFLAFLAFQKKTSRSSSAVDLNLKKMNL